MPSIHSSVNVAQLNRGFLETQRFTCSNFLQPNYAEELRACLEADVDWSVLFVEHDRIKELRREVHDRVEHDVSDIAQRAYESAGRGYSFYFESNRRTSRASDGGPGDRAPLPATLAECEAYLNSADCLQFFRGVTSIPELARTELMATRFGPGHFLLAHDDTADKRKAAFVINLTRNWKPSWGGLLQFLSDQGQIVDTFVPEFNVLHFFRVPQTHTVSFVAPFAQGRRYAISGWLYTA